MKIISSIVTKALKLGPIPYLGLAVVIITTGFILQMRSLGPENLAGGRTIFGIMAQIGGGIGLFGLLTIAFGGGSSADRHDLQPSDLPQSAIDARMEQPVSKVRPTRPSASAGQAGPAPHSAASKLPPLKSSPTSKAGMRMVRQMGMRMLGQALRRG